MAAKPSDTDNAGIKTSPGEEKQAPEQEPVLKFSPEEEAELLSEFNDHKAAANALFNNGAYDQALTKYSEANMVLPNYLDYELAVLQSNISACHLKLQEWKEAISAATFSLDRLDKLEPKPAAAAAAAETTPAAADTDEGTVEVEAEIVSAGASKAAPAPPPTTDSASQDEPDAAAAAARAKKQADISRIRYKALMRRARARSEEGGWQSLEGALADYAALQKMDSNLTVNDRRLVASQLRALPARVQAAKERETAQMWSQLKELGNGILKPFGLSTDSFQMQQDPKTGGYSMNMKSG